MTTSPALAASLASALLLSVTACGGPEDSPEGEAPAPTADDEKNSEPEQDPEEDQGEPAQAEEAESQERETEEPEPEPELPGGGDTVFPDRRLVAAYGSPGLRSWAFSAKETSTPPWPRSSSTPTTIRSSPRNR